MFIPSAVFAITDPFELNVNVVFPSVLYHVFSDNLFPAATNALVHVYTDSLSSTHDTASLSDVTSPVTLYKCIPSLS